MDGWADWAITYMWMESEDYNNFIFTLERYVFKLKTTEEEERRNKNQHTTQQKILYSVLIQPFDISYVYVSFRLPTYSVCIF